jgi:hypothetical protein
MYNLPYISSIRISVKLYHERASMKMLIVFLLAILALFVYSIHASQPVYQMVDRGFSLGPIGYHTMERVCVQNCAAGGGFTER